MTPKISVIMGIYNCASTLQEALDSLYAQTFQDFEIILCDDDSSDNTYQVAEENAQTHKNIVLLKNETNKGLNYTLNRCLSVAKGEYIARMDGDDYSLPHRFKVEVDFLDTHIDYDIVSGPMLYFDENGVFRRGHGKGEIHKIDFIKGSPFCHAPCLVRTRAYKLVGGYTIDKNLLRVEDYHLWFKMYALGLKGYMLGEPIYAMRDDRNAIARRNWKNRKNEIYVRYIGYKMLGLPWRSYIYCLRPLILAILPLFLYNYLHKKVNS